MRCAAFILSFLLGSFTSAESPYSLAMKNPYVNVAGIEERQARVDALFAAYDALDRGLVSSKGKVVVIKNVGSNIVVSFLHPKGERILHGESHVTYDPVGRRVIKVLVD